jgi:dTDP-3-amino-3,4,6-trideoxy-alpha-D-glucose transaminase
MGVPFLDLRPAHDPLSGDLRDAFERVMASSSYVLGQEVNAFEEEFAAYCGAAQCVGVANGMDAIELVLRALGTGPGEEVVTVSHTAFPTAAAISAIGATPVFVDVDAASFTMLPGALTGAITDRTRAIVPVHLYGRPAHMDLILQTAARAGIPVVEDAAQAHGATYDGRRTGTLGQAAAFSFYPTKNLGAFGDGGAVVTNDEALAAEVRRLRNYGESSKYVNTVRGFNSRLDELQAALLRVKLGHLEDWNAMRRAVAARYDELLAGSAVVTPAADEGHVYHLYVVRSDSRDALQRHLAESGVGTSVHYPTPVHRQAAYRDGARQEGSLETTEQLSTQILSLPAYPGLTARDQETVVQAIHDFPA